MTKDEFRSYVKQKFKAMGYNSTKSINYKYVEEDYVICFELYPSSYCKGYQCTYGAILLPSASCYPFCGRYHYSLNFPFPRDPDCELNLSLPRLEQHMKYTYVCEYEKYTVEQIDCLFDINIAHFLMPLYNKEVLFNSYRQEMRRFEYENLYDIVNICKKGGIDLQKVCTWLGAERIEQKCFRMGLDPQEFLRFLEA